MFSAVHRSGMPLFKGQKQSSLDLNETPRIVISGQGLHLSLIKKSAQIPIKILPSVPKFETDLICSIGLG